MKTMFQNPVPFSDGKLHTNPDPFVLSWCGKYYCYATDAQGVNVSVSEDLVHWEYLGFALSREGYHDFWAPAVIYRNGTFYMYVSCNPVGEDDGNGEKMLLATASSPQGPFAWQKTLFSSFSIDAHPVVWNGDVYLFYSVNDWVGNCEDKPGTCILVDKLVTPDQLEGRPVPVVLPSMEQEIYARNRFGDGRDWYTIEGACFIPGPEKSFLLYSANCYTDVNYFVGYSVAQNQPDLRDMVWEKHTLSGDWDPLIRKSPQVEGTGHNTVVPAPNQQDLWMVYHGRNAAEAIRPGQEQRVMHIAPMEVGVQTLHMAPPTTDPQPVPAASGYFASKMLIEDDTLPPLCPTPEYGSISVWVCPERLHTGARYGIMLLDQGPSEQLQLQVNSGRNSIHVTAIHGNLRQTLAQCKLAPGFDHFVPHLIQCRRNGAHWSIWIDEIRMMEFSSPIAQGQLRMCAYYSRVHLYGLTVSEHLRLTGPQLTALADFYSLTPCTLEPEGVFPQGSSLILSRKRKDQEVSETFSILFANGGSVSFHQANTCLFEMRASQREDVFRCQFEQGQMHLMRNGLPIYSGPLGESPLTITLSQGCISSWGYTKIYHEPQKI